MSSQPLLRPTTGTIETPLLQILDTTLIDDRRRSMLAALRQALEARHCNLRDMISDRNLYLRISVIGSCNLSCPFCHNEGAPKPGRMPSPAADQIVEAARRAGSTPTPLARGEPLPQPQIT